MAEKNSTSATLRYFGSQLRLWRTKAGMSREQLAEEIGYSVDLVRSVESGRRMAQSPFIEAVDDVLGAGGLLKGGAPFLVREKYPDWFQEYALYEAEALSLSFYECLLVPGLFQTEAYARAIYNESWPPLPSDDIEQRVTARLARQSLLNRERPPALNVVIAEPALQTLIGGPEVMKEQMRHLMHCLQLRNVTMQVMPTCHGTHPGLAGPMVLIETADRRNLAYIEGQRSSLLFADVEDVSVLTQRYGIIRAQALSPDESLRLLEERAGEL